MKILTFEKSVLQAKLRQELLDAGFPDSWDEDSPDGRVQRRLVVQVRERYVVSVCSDDGTVSWVDASGQPAEPPADLPERVENAQLVEVGDPYIEIVVPDKTARKPVSDVVDAHDPTPPEQLVVVDPLQELAASIREAVTTDAKVAALDEWAQKQSD